MRNIVTDSASAISTSPAPASDGRTIVTASFIGTAIEFYDYYIYGTAAVLSFYLPLGDSVLRLRFRPL